MLMVEVYKVSDKFLSIETAEEAKDYIKDGGKVKDVRLINLENSVIISEEGYVDSNGCFHTPKFGVNIEGAFYDIGKGFLASIQLVEKFRDNSSISINSINKESFRLYQDMVLYILMNRDKLKSISYINSSEDIFNSILEGGNYLSSFTDSFQEYLKYTEEIREIIGQRGYLFVPYELKAKRKKFKVSLMTSLVYANNECITTEVQDCE